MTHSAITRTALIIGGGVAGPVTAMALQRAGIRPLVFEARPEGQDDLGAWLNLAPNGIRALQTLGMEAPVEQAGFLCPGIVFHNSHGRVIGRMDDRAAARRFGAGVLTIKRGQLHRALRDAATTHGVLIQHGKKLVDVAFETGRVIARFADGSEAGGDLLIGCDGLHSATRRLIMPDAPLPVYTGQVGCGGFTECPAVSPAGGWVHMTFGRRSFFGYVRAPDGEVYWFNNVAMPEPARDGGSRPSHDDLARLLLATHRDDPWPIPEIVRSTFGQSGVFPIYDIPSLPTWHTDRVVLVGDAAHATSPHAGQGASMALEDAIVLALCLRDLPDPPRAFEAYERQRRERVEALVARARRNGQQKELPDGPATWFRDLMFPVFMKLAERQLAEVYGYAVDWERHAA